MVAEAVLAELRDRGHEARLFFPDAGLDTPERSTYYSRPDLYHIWRFPLEREGLTLASFPLMIPDPNPRSRPGSQTFRDLSDELLQFYFEEGRRELQQVIDSFQPDIIECQHIWTLPYMVRELGHPYLVTAHHSDQMGYRYDRRMQGYANQAAAGARWIFAISDFVREEILELYPGVSEDKIAVLAGGYDQRIFHPATVDRGRVFQQLGLEDIAGLPLITFSGKISRTKGVDILLRANRLVQEQCKALLIIAGTGHLKNEFTPEQRADFHLENVLFTGHRPQAEVALLHNLAAASVMPSRSEGFGLAALEAMGCGTPVVATRCGGPESYVVGDLVPVEDVESLAQALLKLLTLSAADTKALRQAAHQRAQLYSWERIVDRRLDYYQRSLQLAD
jgi:glycosyltransferase involved in cell wall biosynthesis